MTIDADKLAGLSVDPSYPFHTQPRTARRAGFDQPILHGLCTCVSRVERF